MEHLKHFKMLPYNTYISKDAVISHLIWEISYSDTKYRVSSVYNIYQLLNLLTSGDVGTIERNRLSMGSQSFITFFSANMLLFNKRQFAFKETIQI